MNASLVSRSKANAQNIENSVKVPGYATVDLNAFWNMNPNIKLFTNIQNIGDVRYNTAYNAQSSFSPRILVYQRWPPSFCWRNFPLLISQSDYKNIFLTPVSGVMF